jgi:hypothetical protein
MILTLRYGNIYNYDETYGSTTWSADEFLIASSFFASLRHLGYSIEESYSFTYMYITLKGDPDIEYSSEYTEYLKNIMNLLEKA